MIKQVALVLLLVVSGCGWLTPPSADCGDKKLNGDETDLDCGGPGCGGCAENQLCLVDDDCQSRACVLNRCSAPTCADLIQNGTETGVDCGGSCAPCPGCDGGSCAGASCTDSKRNGAETDVDCGGGTCPTCANTKSCSKDRDCQSAACIDGTCGTPAPGCGLPLLACNSMCVNPLVDPGNCGGCGVICGNDKSCVNGQCTLVCLGGTGACGATCVDFATNTAHCGGCNQPCGPQDICLGGMCFLPCAPMQVPCGNACVSPETDTQHCGGCNRPCAPGASCVNGMCTTSCGAPLTSCTPPDGGVPSCVDTRNDPANCAGCNDACPPIPHTARGCSNSVCVNAGCQPSFADCNNDPLDGCEADLPNDPMNCGNCSQVCPQGEPCNFGICCAPPPPGTYQQTCMNCSTCGGTLSCQCQNSMGLPVPASRPLNPPCGQNISNCNGVLVCGGC